MKTKNRTFSKGDIVTPTPKMSNLADGDYEVLGYAESVHELSALVEIRAVGGELRLLVSESQIEAKQPVHDFRVGDKVTCHVDFSDSLDQRTILTVVAVGQGDRVTVQENDRPKRSTYIVGHTTLRHVASAISVDINCNLDASGAETAIGQLNLMRRGCRECFAPCPQHICPKTRVAAAEAESNDTKSIPTMQGLIGQLTNTKQLEENLAGLKKAVADLSKAKVPGINVKQPPLGIPRRRFRDEQRLVEISAGVSRFVVAKHPIPATWVVEYNEIVERLQQNGDTLY